MKKVNFFDHIQVDEYSSTPKYLQITNSILSAIESGKIVKNNKMPSINEISMVLEVSRDTAEKGYRYLKKIGVIDSIPGKGYYITNVDFRQKLKIFLLFNKLSAHKKIIYDAFRTAIGHDVAIDFYIYHNDFALFKKLLLNKREDYSHYVIIPHFIEGGEKAYEVINTIPASKLVLLDKRIPGVKGEYAAVYENFEKDIYGALVQACEPLKKYHTLKIIFPERSYFPVEILLGFRRFCQQYEFNSKIVYNIENEPIEEGEVYISLMEDDLVTLIEKIIDLELKVGTDVGVISYNETPLKKILLNGITTISTDFREMGTMTANLILQNLKCHNEIPFKLFLRASL